MKKLILMVFLFAIVSNTNAFNPFGRFELNNPNLNKKECWELVKLWVVSDMDDKNAYIAYENWETGKILIKGKYKYDGSSLYAVRNNILVPCMEYEMEINCVDGKYSCVFKDVKFSFKVYDFNPYSLHKFELEIVVYELEEVKDIMMVKGDNWRVDEYFENRNKELEALATNAKNKMNDDKTKKKQRKIYEKQWMEYSSKSSVHHTIRHAVHNLLMAQAEINGKVKNTIE